MEGTRTRHQRVALVHDFLLDLRGAERVFLAMCDLWPDADVYTAVYDEHGTEGRFAERRPRTSFLQRLKPSSRTFRALLPLYPAAIESLDLSGYDLVISSSSAWAHAVICGEGTVQPGDDIVLVAPLTGPRGVTFPVTLLGFRPDDEKPMKAGEDALAAAKLTPEKFETGFAKWLRTR